MKKKGYDPELFSYDEKDGDIVIITWAMGGLYQFHVYKDRKQALHDLYNIWVCNHCLIHCSDEELLQEHQAEIKDARRLQL